MTDRELRALELLAADLIRFHRASHPALEAMSRRARLYWQNAEHRINAIDLATMLRLSTLGADVPKQHPANVADSARAVVEACDRPSWLRRVK